VTALGSSIARRLGAFEQVFENARLRRLELSWGGFWLTEWMQFVALSIYASTSGAPGRSARSAWSGWRRPR